MDRPKIVTLIGSTRFKGSYLQQTEMITLSEGAIVIGVGVYAHADGKVLTAEQKEMLDELHLRKIDLADEVHVINVGGYMGESTQAEIAYARRAGKRVTYLEKPTGVEE